jgi:hypothetical protein
METNDSNFYNVKRFEVFQNNWWKEAQEAKVEHFPWGKLAEVDYRPATSAWLGTDGDSLSIFMETGETNLRSEASGFGFVHNDSCMEFFLSPNPANSSEYLNFEFNPSAAMYLSIGASRHDRIKIPQENYREFFQIKTAVSDKGWNLEYRIPFSFMLRFFPSFDLKPGHIMRGNFYKCGDSTTRPHYGCWSLIELPEPDFHCPDFFGTLQLC